MSRRGLCTLAVASLGAFGCAPRVAIVLERPSEWPEAWNTRKLCATPAALIYAGSAAAAGEADRFVRDTVKAFRSATGATPSRGLVIVTDASDPLILADVDALAALIARSQSKQRGSGAVSSAPGQDARIIASPASQVTTEDDGEVDGEQSWAKQKKKFEELGLPIDVLFRCLPLAVPRADLTATLSFPAAGVEQAAWAVAIPTRAVCRSASSQLISAALGSKEVTFAQRLLIAPWTPLIKSVAAEELAAEREPVLYRQLVLTQAGWTEDERARQLAEYHVQHERQREGRLAAREADVRRRRGSASRRAATQPASAPASAR